MAISDPVGRARAVRTALQAARLMARLEHEISEDSSASEEWHGQADQAIDELRARFPIARRLDAYLEPPASSPAARAGMRDSPRYDRELPRQRRSRARSRSAAGRAARPPRTARHAFEAAALIAAIVGGIALLARHVRRHPRRALAGGVVLAAVATGRPSLIATAGIVGAMISLVRRRPGALPRAPRAPTMPRAPRMPGAPRRPR